MGEGGGPRRLLPASGRRPALVLFARADTFKLPHDAQNEISLAVPQAGALPRYRPGRVVTQGLHHLHIEDRPSVLPSEAAVRRLVTLTLAGLRPPH